jgi:DNA-binding response OmpR family regulator
LRVLLIDGEQDRAAAVKAGLEAAGFLVVAMAPDAGDLIRLVRQAEANVIVPFRGGTERSCAGRACSWRARRDR